MSTAASKTSSEAANSDSNLHDNKAKTLAPSRTRERLSDITDEGLFERLAAGVLRIAEPAYYGIVETGTNVRGQTKSLNGVGPNQHFDFMINMS
jgi:hypothetical protein